MRHYGSQLVVTRCHIQITYKCGQRCYLLNYTQNYLPINAGCPVSSLTILVIILPLSLLQPEIELNKFDIDVVPLSDKGISDVETLRSSPRTLHSQAVVDTQSTFVPTPSEISSRECYLPWSVCSLAQLCSGHWTNARPDQCHTGATVTSK